MKSAFGGFSKEALQFLNDLEQNNDRDWFQPRKEQFDQLIKEPMTRLVEAVNAGLAAFAPLYVTDPKKAIFRIYRDIRFSKNKAPYKTHIAASFSRRGAEKEGAGGYYFSLNHKEVDVGGGIYHPEPKTLTAIRNYLAETHEAFREVTAARKLKKLMGELKGEALSRVPRGFDAEHPAADLLKMKDWVFFASLQPALATTPKLLPEILARFEAITPAIEFLNKPLTTKKRGTAAMF